MITFNAKSAFGDVLDDVSIDEAWSFDDDAAERGARPAMITRRSKQLLISSTAGTNESVYWNAKLEDGRQRVLSGDCGHVYFLEYGADLAVHDIHNPEQWHLWIPSLGYTTELEDLIIEHDNIMGQPGGEEEWTRSYTNNAVGSFAQLVSPSKWAANFLPPDKDVRTRKVWLAADASPAGDGTARTASISACSWRDDGTTAVTLIQSGEGVAWVPEALARLTRERHCESVAVDEVGPLTSVLPEIRRRSACKVETYNAKDVVAACASALDAINEGRFHHKNQDQLTAAVMSSVKRVLLDGFAIARRRSGSDQAPFVSAVLAHWSCVLHPLQSDPFRIYSHSTSHTRVAQGVGAA